MLKNLSSGTKISITRSIKTSFEQYMSSIQWKEDKFDIQNFIVAWRIYINEHASWYKNLDKEIKNNEQFHEELAVKINETIAKVLSEEPSAQQIAKLEELQEKSGTDIDYACKLEAKYLIDKLETND
ncbi:hypothetical protein [Rossellomorea vietnamensis]|uniref:hypothetical protein n=1 Tax=Rossellomorea vietnamensis TaxID=218284 RepID=UPI00077C32BC|nr:hypothetical protein [Rossellomorea vietnamensis]